MNRKSQFLAGAAGLIALGTLTALTSYAVAQAAGVYTAAQADQGHADLDLIRQALDQRDVLPRLRSAVADISADN